MAAIQGITGAQFTPESKDWADHKYQYALSSFVSDNRINPALIVYPKDKDEISLTIKYAKAQKLAIAIRTGRHQYCGASSTIAPNIQIDLPTTFKTPDDMKYFENGNEAFVRTSVSHPLHEFADFLGKHSAFVPHGQCINVHLGGHIQTGGYGQMIRTFGLLGDQVLSLEIIDHEGTIKELTKESDPELFHAILGVYRDQDYQGSRGVKSLFWYKPEKLKELLDILVEMADDENFPGNYDYCVSALSENFPVLDLFGRNLDEKMKSAHPEIYGKDGIPFYPRCIVVYAQWVPFSTADVCDIDWFNRITKRSLFDLPVKEKAMSILAKDWLFENTRKFEHPYVKSTHVTNSRTLGVDGWAEWVTGRIDAIVIPEPNKCFLSSQIQVLGGINSRFAKNANNGTAYSWRDSTVVIALDCFYEEGHKSTANDWHQVNEEEGYQHVDP